MIITFCGHASYIERDGDEEKLLSLLTEIIGDSPAELYLGGYGAFDEFARRCGSKYQDTHPDTRLVFVTPYITEEYQKNHLEPIKRIYDATVYPPIENVPMRFAISHRNKWMAEQADVVVAYITHEFGGAYGTYKHAKRKQKKIFNFAEA